MNNIETIIESIGVSKSFYKGEMLFYSQDKAKGLYYVQAGIIRVFRMDEQGKEVEVVRLEKGDYLGEAILFVSSVFPFFAQAAEDSQLLFVSKESLFRSLETNPDLSKFFLKLLAKKCVILNKRIDILGFKTVRQRLIHYLITRCKGKTECRIDLPVKKIELAQLLGTISETLSRNLKQLQAEKLIEVKGKRIIIKNCPKLREEISQT